MTADFRGLVVFRVTNMTYTTATVLDISTFDFNLLISVFRPFLLHTILEGTVFVKQTLTPL